VPVALELAQQVAQRRRDQAQHRPPRARHQRPRRPAPRRGGGLADLQRRQRRVGAAVPAEAQQQLVGVRQYAPFRASTTGIVRARMVRSSQMDQVSM
jgi:hypothetical protein